VVAAHLRNPRSQRPGERLARAVQKLRGVRSALWLVPLLAGAALYMHRGTLWNRALSALNPIPAADQALDEQLRAEAGAPMCAT